MHMTKYKSNKYFKKGQLGSLSTCSKSTKWLLVQVSKGDHDDQFHPAPNPWNV